MNTFSIGWLKLNPVHSLKRTRGLALALCMGVLATPPQVHALTFTSDLNFVAPTQSLWSPGGSTASFGAKGGVSVGIFDLFSYDIGASSGTVSGSFQSTLQLDYSDYAKVNGTTQLSLGLLGGGGTSRIKSDLGAKVLVEVVEIDLLNLNYALEIDKTSRVKLDQPLTGTDTVPLVGKSVSVLVAEAGASLNVDQRDSFTVDGISGTLAYQPRFGGAVHKLGFDIDTPATSLLSLHLDSVGMWDFWLEDLTLNNRFSTDFDGSLVFWEEHVSGVDWCYGWFGVKYPCGFKETRNEVKLASIDLYDTKPFALDFNRVSDRTHRFSIMVVPEPSTSALAALSLVLALTLTKRRRVIVRPDKAMRTAQIARVI
jgi:hypothetical protein